MAYCLERNMYMASTIETAANENLNSWFGWSIDNELDLSNLVRDGVDPSVIDTLIEHGFNQTYR